MESRVRTKKGKVSYADQNAEEEDTFEKIIKNQKAPLDRAMEFVALYSMRKQEIMGKSLLNCQPQPSTRKHQEPSINVPVREEKPVSGVKRIKGKCQRLPVSKVVGENTANFDKNRNRVYTTTDNWMPIQNSAAINIVNIPPIKPPCMQTSQNFKPTLSLANFMTCQQPYEDNMGGPVSRPPRVRENILTNILAQNQPSFNIRQSTLPTTNYNSRPKEQFNTDQFLKQAFGTSYQTPTGTRGVSPSYENVDLMRPYYPSKTTTNYFERKPRRDISMFELGGSSYFNTRTNQLPQRFHKAPSVCQSPLYRPRPAYEQYDDSHSESLYQSHSRPLEPPQRSKSKSRIEEGEPNFRENIDSAGRTQGLAHRQHQPYNRQGQYNQRYEEEQREAKPHRNGYNRQQQRCDQQYRFNPYKFANEREVARRQIQNYKTAQPQVNRVAGKPTQPQTRIVQQQVEPANDDEEDPPKKELFPPTPSQHTHSYTSDRKPMKQSKPQENPQTNKPEVKTPRSVSPQQPKSPKSIKGRLQKPIDSKQHQTQNRATRGKQYKKQPKQPEQTGAYFDKHFKVKVNQLAMRNPQPKITIDARKYIKPVSSKAQSLPFSGQDQQFMDESIDRSIQELEQAVGKLNRRKLQDDFGEEEPSYY